MKRLIPVFALFFCLGSWNASGQLRKPVIVSVNISGTVLAADASSSGIPFDEAFVMAGSATGIEKIELTYRIDPRNANYSRWYAIGLKVKGKRYKITGDKDGIDWATKNDSLYITVNESDFGYTGKHNVKFTIKEKGSAGTGDEYTYQNYTLVKTAVTPPISCSFIESPHYYPNVNTIGADGFTRVPELWNRPDDATATFSLNAGPLHDNLKYNFRFRVYLANNIGAKQAELAAKIVALLKTQITFETINKRQGIDNAALGQAATAVIRTYTDKRGDLVMGDQKPLLIDLTQTPFKELKTQLALSSDRVARLKAAKQESIDRLLKKIDAFLPGAALSAYQGLSDDITDISKGTAVLTPDAKKIWNAAVPGFTCKLSDIATTVADGTKVLDVIKGDKKINPDGTLANTGPGAVDPASISALWFFCQTISANEMLATYGRGSPKPLFLTTGFHRFKGYMEVLSAAASTGDTESLKQIAKEMSTASPGLLNDPGSPITVKLDQAIAKTNLSDATKNLLDQPLNASIPDYKAMTVLDALTLLDNGFANPNIFAALINGSGKISGTFKSIEPTVDGQVSIPSLQVLNSIFSLLDTKAFFGDAAHPGQLFTPVMHTDLIANRLFYYLAKLNAIAPELQDYTTFNDQFARLMADTYIKKTYLLSGASIADQNVDANKNLYVGVDIGMGNAFGINTFFVHEGLNIYLSPINRNASISSLHGWDRIRKTFSLFVGLTQTISASNVNDRYSNLFNDGGFKTSALFGIGWRFSTLARLNFAGLVYREKSLNPLVTSTQVKVAPAVTLAIDIALGKLIKSLSTL